MRDGNDSIDSRGASLPPPLSPPNMRDGNDSIDSRGASLPPPWHSSFLPDWLARCAMNLPGHLAVQCGQVQWNFAELDRQATRLARQLATAGVQEGSRIALLAGNGLSFIAFVHALIRLGAILVPLNVRLTLEELCWQVQDVHAMLLVSDERHAATATQIGQIFPGLLCATLADNVGASGEWSGWEGLYWTQSGGLYGPPCLYPKKPTFARSGEQISASAETALNALPETNVPLRTLIDLSATQAILYTSGTTGRPKGVLITYGMQWWNAVGSALNLGHNPADRWLACLPFFHIGGLAILMRSVIYGISVIVQEKFDAIAVNRAIYEDKVTIISVVAVMLQRMLSALDTDTSYPSTLRCVLLGGGPAPRLLLEDCIHRGIPVVQTYGLTEACSQAVTLAPADALRKLGSAGRPLLPVQLRIMCDGQPASTGEPGEIFLKGPTITPGYVNRPDATAQVLHDGWLSTGDIGYLDDEGYLYVLDRRADLIVSGGENVYPAEIEAILLAHPDVEEAGVCRQSDPQWGQVPIAFVHLRTSSATSTDDLIAYAMQHLARYKLPRMIYLTDQLPRNSSGKLLRSELHRLLPTQR